MVARSSRTNVYTKVHRMPKMYSAPKPPSKRRPRFRHLFALLFWLAVSGGIAYIFVIGPLFKVQKVEVKGTLFSDPDTFSNKVELNQHILFIPKQGIEYDILQDPAVESAQLLRGLPDSVRIVVVEKKPALLWISGGLANILDEDGKVFYQYPESQIPSGDTEIGKALSSVRVVYDRQNMPVKLGQRVVSPLFISFVESVGKEIAHYVPEYPVLQFEVTGSSFFDIQASMQGGITADLSVLADAGVQARNLARLVKSASLPSPAHVDLRIDRWAYVK